MLNKFISQSLNAPPNSTPSGSVAQQGIFSSAFNTYLDHNTPWIIDSGASDHMTSYSNLFSTYLPCSGNRKIKIADGSLSPIAGTGSIPLTKGLTLTSVLHVPKLSCNLFSVSAFTKSNNCVAKFFPTHCDFQALDSGKTIGSAREINGLYYFLDGAALEGQAQVVNKTPSISEQIMLWHFRLGHPTFSYLQKLFPLLFKKKIPTSYNVKYVNSPNIKDPNFVLHLIKVLHLLFLYIVIFGVLLEFLIFLILLGL